ncbi:DUF4279 domain-containing protein [Streptomyces sp. NPDC048637]|uniref:DUF4279 domain-containing protein n=1 Tax=Streptomyces sp. NPDC048637 TaxID=3155636 RepID=UPI00343603F4
MLIGPSPSFGWPRGGRGAHDYATPRRAAAARQRPRPAAGRRGVTTSERAGHQPHHAQVRAAADAENDAEPQQRPQRPRAGHLGLGRFDGAALRAVIVGHAQHHGGAAPGAGGRERGRTRRSPRPAVVPVDHSWMVVCREPGLRVDEQITRILDRLQPHTDRISGLTRHLAGTGGGAVLHLVRCFHDTGQAQRGAADAPTSSVGTWTARSWTSSAPPGPSSTSTSTTWPEARTPGEHMTSYSSGHMNRTPTA